MSESPAAHIATLACEAVTAVAPDMVHVLVNALSRDRPAAVRHELRNLLSTETSPIVMRLIEAAGDYRTAAVAMAAAAAAHEAAVADKEHVSIVWTGPETVQIPVRPTTTVVHELIATAQERLTLATYSASDVQDLISALNQRRADGVAVRLLLESRRTDGSGPDSIEPFAALIPHVAAVKWPRAARPSHDGSSMHIKVVVCDDHAVLVTSANLSKPAQLYDSKHGNMELGVLIHGPDTARRIQTHFDELVANGTLRPIEVDGADGP